MKKHGFVACSCGGSLIQKKSTKGRHQLNWVQCNACGRSEIKSMQTDGAIVEKGRAALIAFNGAVK